MTYEEAINELQYGIKCPEGQSDVVRIIWSGDTREAALNIAIKALEKQIPKEPIAIDVGGQHELICPNCERNHVARHGIMYSYCNICGQRISWTHENDSEVE